MGKIQKKKLEKDDSFSGVSQQSNNIATPLRRSVRQSVHVSATKVKAMNTPAKIDAENQGDFISPRQPPKPKSARKEKILQTMNREDSLLNESMPELVDTPVKATSSAVKVGRGRPKSARKTLTTSSILDKTTPMLLSSPLQPIRTTTEPVDTPKDAVVSSAAKASRGRPKSARKTLQIADTEALAGTTTDQKDVSNVDTIKEEGSAVKVARGRPKSARRTMKFADDAEAPTQIEDVIVLVVEDKSPSTANQEGPSVDEEEAVFDKVKSDNLKASAVKNGSAVAEEIVKEIDTENQEHKEEVESIRRSIKQKEESVYDSMPSKETETVSTPTAEKRKSVNTDDQPTKVKKVNDTVEKSDVQLDNEEKIATVEVPVSKTVETEASSISNEVQSMVESKEPSIAIDETMTNENVKDIVEIAQEDKVESQEPCDNASMDKDETVANENMQEVIVEPTEIVQEDKVEEGVPDVEEDELKMDTNDVEENLEEKNSVETKPEEVLNTTFDLETNDLQYENEEMVDVEAPKQCLTIDLIEEEAAEDKSEDVLESANKPETKILNTIDLVTPGTEKRPRPNDRTTPIAGPAAIKLIEIMDTPELAELPKTPAETSILKNASSSQRRMTRSNFLSGCNDSIYIHAEHLQLKSCRKRSQSFCIDDPNKSVRKNNRVQFYSPLNMEIDIATIDTRLQQSFVESAAGKRRKRSLSVPNLTNQNSDGAKKLAVRSKIPNFQAIHEQNFKKMESIADHLVRKAERSKQFLAGSKSPIGSAKKATTPLKPVQLPGKSTFISVPVAHVAPITNAVAPKVAPSAKPTIVKPIVTQKPLAAPASAPANKTSVPPAPKQADVKNISTVSASRSFAVNRDKTAQRLQSYKRMDGGGANTDANKNKRHAAIKGVRSNRRFELQMQFRDRDTQAE